MLLLAIDTATQQVGVAVGSPDGVLAEVRLAQGRRHAEQLAPAIGYALAEAQVSVGDLTAVAVGIGPGLFTGVRVGVTTAKVMAHTLGVPVVPVSSLDLVAHPLAFVSRPVVAVTDARRGEVYWATYHAGPGPEGLWRVGTHRVGSPEALVSELAGARWLAAGDGAVRYQPCLEEGGSVTVLPPAFSFPSPSALVDRKSVV